MNFLRKWWIQFRKPKWFPIWWDDSTVEFALEILYAPPAPKVQVYEISRPQPRLYLFHEATNCDWTPKYIPVSLVKESVTKITVAKALGHDFNPMNKVCVNCGIREIDFDLIRKKDLKLCQNSLVSASQ